jgi:transcriptional regulator with XRE-family HTH domain
MSTQSTARALPVFTLGDYLAKSRSTAGLSQQDMADRLLVSRTTVVNWENDHTYPSPRRLTAWAMATGVTVQWLRQGAVVRGNATTGWLSVSAQQPRGHIGRGVLGSWDHHHYPRLRLAPTG